MLDPLVDNMLKSNKKLIAAITGGEKTCDDYTTRGKIKNTCLSDSSLLSNRIVSNM